MKKQNKLGTYLTVTAGVGCAASVAKGAIVVVDLSQVLPSSDGRSFAFPLGTGDGVRDLILPSTSNFGYLIAPGTLFYSNVAGVDGTSAWARAYSAGPASFPTDADTYGVWTNGGIPGGGFVVGLNWMAFKDSVGNYGWFSFTMDSLGTNSTNPITSFGHFVYDDSSTAPSNAIALETAIAAVPEPSSLALLALGSAGLAARRRRQKAA